MLLDVPPDPRSGNPGCPRCSPRVRPASWSRAHVLAERYAGLFRPVPCGNGPGYHLALIRHDEGVGVPGGRCGDDGDSPADVGVTVRRGEFARDLDQRLPACCNQDTALTVGELRAAWAEVDDATPILVARDGYQADWAQRADVIAAEDGLAVARLFAPWAKQGRPAPGTVWVPATPISGEPAADDGDRTGA